MAAETPVPTGRVCYYARQQCALERGCPTIGPIAMGEVPEDVELRAYDCVHARLQLFDSEVKFSRMRGDAAAPADRVPLLDQRIKKARRALHARTQRQYNDAAAAAREERQAAQEDQ